MQAKSGSPATGIRMPSLGLVGGTQGPLIGLILLCIVFSVSSDFFLSVRNALNILDQVTVLGILAIGMTAERSSAYGGTCRVSEKRRKIALPGIISSRA